MRNHKWLAAVQGKQGWVGSLEAAEAAGVGEKYRIGVFDTFIEARQALSDAMAALERKLYPERAEVADRVLEYIGWPQSEFRRVLHWLSIRSHREAASKWMDHNRGHLFMGAMIKANLNLDGRGRPTKPTEAVA